MSICDQNKAPPHITHGSIVTYMVHPFKYFPPRNSAAEVIACVEVEDKYHISLIFTRIREEDQELLVRASLHLQTQQLRKRAKQHHDE